MSDEETIAGILTLLAIGAVIHNRRDNDREPAADPRPRRDRNWRALPATCRRDIETRRRGTVRMFTQRCLNNNYRHMNRLPRDCQIQVRTDTGQRRQGYAAQCLRPAGFHTARR